MKRLDQEQIDEIVIPSAASVVEDIFAGETSQKIDEGFAYRVEF